MASAAATPTSSVDTMILQSQSTRANRGTAANDNARVIFGRAERVSNFR